MKNSESSRFEVRCTPEIRELLEFVRAVEGDTTYSQMFRRMLVREARGMGKRLIGDERVRLKKILARLSEAT